MRELRTITSGWWQVPLLYVPHDLVGRGAIEPAANGDGGSTAPRARAGRRPSPPRPPDPVPSAVDARGLRRGVVRADRRPGPSVLYIVGASISQGRRAGLTSMLGVQAGGLIHVFAAAIGVSALIASSAEAFTVVKFAGAAYLVYLGVQRIRHAGEDDHGGRSRRSHAHLFRQGVVVNVLNPKVAIFFVAFLPQFIDPDAGSPGLQIIVLGLALPR